MQSATILTSKDVKTKLLLYDFIVLSFVYFLPALSHAFALPLYLLEPMRFVLIFSLFSTSRKNVFFLALSMPLFSYVSSGHPLLIKSLLISFELLINAVIFFRLNKSWDSPVFSVLVSVLASKILYYIFKYLLLTFGLLDGNLISSPTHIQLIVLAFAGIIAFLMLNFNQVSKNKV